MGAYDFEMEVAEYAEAEQIEAQRVEDGLSEVSLQYVFDTIDNLFKDFTAKADSFIASAKPEPVEGDGILMQESFCLPCNRLCDCND